MSLIRTLALSVLAAGLLLGNPVGAQQPPGGEGEQSGHSVAQQGHESAPKSTLEMENEEFFLTNYKHLMPHVFGVEHGAHSDAAPNPVAFYNVNAAQIVALLLMLIVFGSVLASARSAGGPWIIRVFRGFCRWIRDEMVVKVMGEEEARVFTPFFLYLFFFIAFMNLLGMIPVYGVTATACVYVTASLALITFGMMVIGGMMKQGAFAFWKNLLPHGLPAWLVPLMVLLELIGLLVKPFALTIRLFANMLAGHLVIYSFIGMIFLFAKMMHLGPAAYATAAFSAGMGVFISIIEAFVALLQAYIFTFLTIVFVQQARHPAH